MSQPAKTNHRVLVLGAYGLIGAAVVRRLLVEGYDVIGLGRDQQTSQSVLPQISWIIRDLSDLCERSDWSALIHGTDFVVNCAGALQDSPNDNLDAVHHRAIAALVGACEEADVGIIQISAVGAAADASTRFLRSKAQGDALVRAAKVPVWIYRPGLVIAQTSYGGSAMLRMLAAFPLVQPLAHADAQVQTVGSADIAEAVVLAVRGDVSAGLECDLVEDVPTTLGDVVLKHRIWLGFGPPWCTVLLPGWAMTLTSKMADLLGVLGWRSPLRSTGVRVLRNGVTGDPSGWLVATGKRIPTLDETLTSLTAGVEQRQSARMSLVMPLVFCTLFFFWLSSGVIGFLQVDAASRVLRDVGWTAQLAMASVLFWSIVDIAIAFGLLVRKFAAWSCWAMIAVSLIYLASATLVVPALWLDPLGPLVKVVPGIVLALIARMLLDDR
ncbi:MAG: SDR family oxidoreductase [Pseudomonadota bacterium]